MNKPLQAPITQFNRLDQMTLLVFSDALKIAEDEEEYELCSILIKTIKEYGNRAHN